MSSSNPNGNQSITAGSNATPTTTSTTDSDSRSVATRGRTDMAWNHVTELEKNKFKCLYCGKVFSGGGIHRVKKYLANIKGDVASCKKVPPNVLLDMKNDLQASTPTNNKKCHVEKSSPFSGYRAIDDEEDVIFQGPSLKRDRESNMKKDKGVGGSVQPSIKSAMAGKDAIERAHLDVAKWFYESCIPFNAANSPRFQAMFDSASTIGYGYRAPTFHDLRGFLLKKSVEDVKGQIESFKELWELFGCTIMTDGWTDNRGRTLINFLAYCPKGTIFLKSIDASEHSKTGEMLSQLFISIVEEVGPKNVIQIVTDNASNYRLAGHLLNYKYPFIVWTPCAAHSIDLMLEDIAKMVDVKEAIAQARSISTFIYNHGFVLNLMRKFTGGKEIVRPAITRFATNFIALQSILNCKNQLRAMMTSTEWVESKWSNNQKGKVVSELILSTTFWDHCLIIVKAFEPLVRVLRMVDSDERPAMGYIYESMCRAKNAMKKTLLKFKISSDPYIAIVDNRWENHLSRPLHLAGHYFNPQFHYHMDENTRIITMKGVLETIHRLTHGDIHAQTIINQELDTFHFAHEEFGRPAAIATRYTISPVLWWQIYGISTPTLQKVALKILSQTCSSSGCERNWSVFERIHTKKRNRLEHQRLCDLVYVQYNLRLLDRKKKKYQYFDPISLEDIDILEEWVVEEEAESPLLRDEDIDNWVQMDQPNSSRQTKEDDNLGTLMGGQDGDAFVELDDDES